MTRTLPEDLLPIICDHYAFTRQLRALATVSLLNHRISGYARTRLFKQFEFIDDRSSRVLEHADMLCAIYEDGELLDEDILSIVDSKEIDPLDLDPELRWLKGMRICETIVIKDLLYGRDIESIITLSTSLSERNLVLFPKVENVVIGGKLVKRILATEQRGPRPKITPLDLLIAIFHSTRPKILCIQDSAIFTPPPTGFPRMMTQQSEIGGRIVPSRGGHISNTIIQFIKSTESFQEIHYQAVNPNIPIHPKKGIHHIIQFIPDPNPEAVIATFSLRISHEGKIVREIKDIITRSIVGRYEMESETGMFSPGGGGGGGGLFGGTSIGQGVRGQGLLGGGALFGTGTGVGNGIGGAGGGAGPLFGTGVGVVNGGGGGALFGTGTGVGNGVGGAGGLFGGPTGGQLFGTAIGVGNGGGGTALFGTGTGNGGFVGQRPTFGAGTHAHFPLFGTQPPLQLFGTQLGQIPVGTGTVPSTNTGGIDTNTVNTGNGNTTVPGSGGIGTGDSTNTTPGPSTSTLVNTVAGPSTVNTTPNAIAGPSTSPNPGDDDDNQSTRSDGDTYNSDTDSDPEDELPAYAPPVHIPRTRPTLENDTRDSGRKQSSWKFILPSPTEVEDIKRQVMVWAERIKGDVGDDVRAGIGFGVIGEEECDCGI